MHSAHNTYLKTFQYIFEKNYNCIDYVLSKQNSHANSSYL